MRFLFSLLLFAGMLSTGTAQQRPVMDTSVIRQRSFSPSGLQNRRADRDFQYEGIRVPPKSLWDRMIEWLREKLRPLTKALGGGLILETLLILLAVAALVFFIINSTGMNRAGLFGKKNTGKRMKYGISDESIHQINFEQAIQEAVRQKNYRMAVRLLYLQSLKRLTDLGLIDWKINKTNVSYVRELEGREFQEPFLVLTLQFENNWYGDLPISEQEFGTVEERFRHFTRQLQ